MARQLELLTKHLAAERLKISVRRLMELSAEGQIKRHRAVDPATKREAVMFAAADVEKLQQVWNSVPGARAPLALPAPAGAIAAEAEPEEDYDAPLRPWLTILQASEYSGLPASILLRFVESGRLPALDVGVRPGGHWRVRQIDVDAIEGDRRKGGR
jgi:excisionase family DNA binding protein